MVMVTRYLSRPNNVLINKLGHGTTWKTPSAFSHTTRRFFFLFKVFFNRFFDFIWRSGLLHTNHPFGGCFFFKSNLLVLPLIRSVEDVNKYFRLTRIRSSSRLKGKRFFVSRRYLHYLSLGEFYLYRLNNLILILLFIHIPEPIKRRFFLAEYLGLGNVQSKEGFRLPSLPLVTFTQSSAFIFFTKIFYLL
uniref:Uncharacterized protein ORF190 n=1 Tax=Moneuplotes minuta TaxID=74792 RepID=D1LDQ7_9SPIT|nr:hypothetical protein [Moneuplotes minuta]